MLELDEEWNMIISLGEALIDFISQEALNFSGFPGGSPFNTSIAIARQGIPCSFLGRVSRDLFGKQLVSYLKDNRVATDMIVFCNDATTLSFVRKQSDGQAQYAFFANGTADKCWRYEDLRNFTLPREARMLHFGSISLSQEPCGEVLHDFLKEKCQSLFLSFDPNIRPSLVQNRQVYMKRFENLCSMSALVKLSDEDLHWLYPHLSREKGIGKILSLGVGLCALTEGREGARLCTPKLFLKSPLHDLPVADTVGAGDTFHGALLSWLYEQKIFHSSKLEALGKAELEALGAFANKAAGINCHRNGANPPFKKEMYSRKLDSV